MSLIGYVTNLRLRRYLYNIVSKVLFRIITRSLSAVIRFHDIENKPKNKGFCVANHTTPMDVALLTTEKKKKKKICN